MNSDESSIKNRYEQSSIGMLINKHTPALLNGDWVYNRIDWWTEFIHHCDISYLKIGLKIIF